MICRTSDPFSFPAAVFVKLLETFVVRPQFGTKTKQSKPVGLLLLQIRNRRSVDESREEKPQAVCDVRGHWPVVPRVQDVHTPSVHRKLLGSAGTATHAELANPFPQYRKHMRRGSVASRKSPTSGNDELGSRSPALLQTEGWERGLQASATAGLPAVDEQTFDLHFRLFVRHKYLLITWIDLG